MKQETADNILEAFAPITPLLLARWLMWYNAWKKIGSSQWAPHVDHEKAEKGINKCNIFISDIAEISGTKSWSQSFNEGTFSFIEPLAADWGAASFKITGWEVVGDRHAGDVISDGSHVGIVSFTEHHIISASSTANIVRESPWRREKAVCRRFMGPTNNIHRPQQCPANPPSEKMPPYKHNPSKTTRVA